MNNVKFAFDVVPDGQNAPIGQKCVNFHMIFDVKMEDFRQKARYVTVGHMTNTPPMITYASVVSRETVRLALTIVALNNFQVNSAGIMNAYFTAPIIEKIWTVLGLDFESDAGKKAIIVRALYGLNSYGASFRNHLVYFMHNMGYKYCMADIDLWLNPEVRPSNRFEY